MKVKQVKAILSVVKTLIDRTNKSIDYQGVETKISGACSVSPQVTFELSYRSHDVLRIYSDGGSFNTQMVCVEITKAEIGSEDAVPATLLKDLTDHIKEFSGVGILLPPLVCIRVLKTFPSPEFYDGLSYAELVENGVITERELEHRVEASYGFVLKDYWGNILRHIVTDRETYLALIESDYTAEVAAQV